MSTSKKKVDFTPPSTPSQSRTPVIVPSDEKVASEWNDNAIPLLVLQGSIKNTIPNSTHMKSKVISKLKPIQRSILGEWFMAQNCKSHPKIFQEWYNKHKADLGARESVLAAFHALENLGYKMEETPAGSGKMVLYKPSGEKAGEHHDLLEHHKASKGYNNLFDWNDYNYYNNYIDYSSSQPMHP
eukprot:789331_1